MLDMGLLQNQGDFQEMFGDEYDVITMEADKAEINGAQVVEIKHVTPFPAYSPHITICIST